MDADVGGHTAGLIWFAFPRMVIPDASGGDISEGHIVLVMGRFLEQLLAKRQKLGVEA